MDEDDEEFLYYSMRLNEVDADAWCWLFMAIHGYSGLSNITIP